MVRDFKDYCHNGLQVEGAEKIDRIVTGVTLSKKLIEAAIGQKAQMILVHHGFFMGHIPSPPVVSGVTRDRLKLLLQHDINLGGFHLPLDAHPKIGNNASLCKLFGLKNLLPVDIGFMGILPKTLSLKDFVAVVDKKLGVQSHVIPAGEGTVKRVAVISGGASPHYQEASNAGADTFVCGDIREGVVREIEETGINLINAGHYNTERSGIQNLGELVAKKFKIKVTFVDVPCEI